MKLERSWPKVTELANSSAGTGLFPSALHHTSFLMSWQPWTLTQGTEVCMREHARALEFSRLLSPPLSRPELC